MIKRSVKKSQVIVPFGPGAILNFGNESFLALDITQWPENACRDIRLDRLEQLLKVQKFKEPPLIPSNIAFDNVNSRSSVPYMRFPRWLFCPQCRSMIHWNYDDEERGEMPICPECNIRRKKVKLSPMRFMAVCEDGHLTDVDWNKWAHSNPLVRCENPKLKFESRANCGGGWQAMFVKCETCGSERDLKDLAYPNALQRIGVACPGRHPWQAVSRAVACDKKLKVVSRGESNAYFPVIVSAIDIRVIDVGSITGADEVKAHLAWPILLRLYNYAPNPSPQTPELAGLIALIATDTQQTKDFVWEVLIDHIGVSIEELPPNADNLLKAEWKVLLNPPSVSGKAPLIAEIADLYSYGKVLPKKEENTWLEFRKVIEKVVLVKRIRVVNALTGFRRLDPAGALQTPALGNNKNWLPAVEVFGEGVFLSLDQNILSKWEESIPNAYIDDFILRRDRSNYQFLPVPTPRFILLHTFAHLLIRQLCYECGYSSSSLTERIYSGPDMAGILIYTASSDSQGALGGLVREAQPERFYGILKTALFRSQWCSNDPICSEIKNQGVGGLNRAACHACTLVSETSCQYVNTLLDRNTIYGKSDTVPGFFASLLNSFTI